MKPLEPASPWEHLGIHGPSRLTSLLFSKAAEALVVVSARRLDEGIEVRRLYYRLLPWELYSPVGVRHPRETQEDAVCCWDAPLLFFNERLFREPAQKSWYPSELLKGQQEPPTFHAVDWLCVRRFNLQTGEDEVVLDDRTLRPPPPFIKGYVSRLLSVSADGTSAVCEVGFELGGQMRHFVYEVALPGGLTRMIAELPNVFA